MKNGDGGGAKQGRAKALVNRLGGKPIVLVGMMGAGKTTVGRRLANRMGRLFVDSDEEIERAAQMTIPEIFAQRGEVEFRAGELRVISRLLKEKDIILATGGGAFVQPETRAAIKDEGLSVWLKADADVLFERVSRRSNRPLLQTQDPRGTLEKLIAERYPIYEAADVTVMSRDVPQETVATDIVSAVLDYLRTKK
ncbi:MULTISPECIES: shikimate kinase [unclassified Devosia]|uniref:shikimate kinase n=1 Tax=unclassified Devosia TaxID=196773 RepID=UPI00145E984B|nr:shikimate kinase [Devosia sp. MC521]MBJ6987639.1 shikimate kinase [Devosia sp. MC521]MBJ7578700.1 shikimate kinase [Devosia sp. MC532]MBK1795337.1 shikimate kinase [Devosia sp. WQ 349K1]QMW62325.1 shikimate kinase [Devosia sp. MC521]